MPRDGALTLADVQLPTLSIVCGCGRSERYAVVNLINEHGDAKLTDLLWDLANCHEWRSDGAHSCRAVYEGCCSRIWL